MTYEALLTATAVADEQYIVMTAENRALVRNIPAVLGNRFIDTGITEQTMIGAAAGLALRGRIPVVHALTAFLTMRAFEFIRTDIGIPALPVKLSGFIPGLLSDANGPTHQALEDISLMRGIPNMEVFAPADEEDLVLMLPHIWSAPSPAYVRINTRPSAYKHQPYVYGKAEIIKEGSDVTLITYGLMLEQCLLAAQLLEQEGKSVGLINMRSLKPVDEKALVAAAQNSKLLVTVEDHFLTGGLYSIIAEVFLKHRITTDIIPFAFKERWFKPALLNEVMKHEGFTGKQIAEEILGYTTDEVATEILPATFAE